jgi:hypothetical protein
MTYRSDISQSIGEAAGKRNALAAARFARWCEVMDRLLRRLCDSAAKKGYDGVCADGRRYLNELRLDPGGFYAETGKYLGGILETWAKIGTI